MTQTKNPIVRTIIHAFLILWAAYSVLPFVWSIITSTQIPRDARARDPRFVPQAFADNSVLIGIVVFLLIVGIYLLIRRISSRPMLRSQLIMVVGIAAILAVAIMIFPSLLPDDNTYVPTGDNYTELWLRDSVEEFTPVLLGILIIVAGLLAVGFNAGRIPLPKSVVYFVLAMIAVLTLVLLPNFFRFAVFYEYGLNSIVVTVLTVIVSISIGCLAGYGLARYSGMSGVVILFVALAFRALPRMAFVLPYYYIGQLSGLYDTHLLLTVTLVAINQPFTIWMLRSFFMDIPREIEEAAMIDGCSRLQSFTRVIVPIVWPGIITTALFTLLLAYNEFLMARILMGENWTLPVAISPYTSGEDTRYIPLAAASGVSITIPIVFIIIFFQRYLIKGLAGGAVKG